MSVFQHPVDSQSAPEQPVVWIANAVKFRGLRLGDKHSPWWFTQLVVADEQLRVAVLTLCARCCRRVNMSKTMFLLVLVL